MMTTDKQPAFLYCQRDNTQVPLIALNYKNIEAWICSEHLPVLIHDPQELVGKLPGAERLTPRND